MSKYLSAVGALALIASTAATAQSAHHTPQQIVCAMTGHCGPNSTDPSRQISVGDEKAFSLIKSGPTSSFANAPSRTAAPHAARSALADRRNPHSANLPAVQPGAGHMDMLVSFDFGSSNLTDSGKQEASAFVTALAAPDMAGMHFNIEGHTDSIGSRGYNLSLSKQRAQSVVNYLVAQGVDRSRLTAQGYGFDHPRTGLQPSDGGNRRVEFVRSN